MSALVRHALEDRIRSLVHRLGSIRNAARALGVSRTAVHGWYHGEHEPTGATRRVASEALDRLDAEADPTARR